MVRRITRRTSGSGSNFRECSFVTLERVEGKSRRATGAAGRTIRRESRIEVTGDLVLTLWPDAIIGGSSWYNGGLLEREFPDGEKRAVRGHGPHCGSLASRIVNDPLFVPNNERWIPFQG
jgi:hypothetical protein